MPSNDKQITVFGITYRSIAQAVRVLQPEGVSESLVRTRINDIGMTPERAMTQPIRGKRVTIDGYTYTSIKDAWRAVAPDGLTYANVLNRIDRGWEAWRALKVRTQ